MASHDIVIVETRAGLEALESEWRALDAGPAVRPFQQFGWISAWLRTLGADEALELKIATLRQGVHLAALLPLCVRRYKGLRLLEWIAARVSDYCDAVVAPGVEPEPALQALWQAVAASGGFDIARLSHVRTDATVFSTLTALEPWTETYEDAGGVSIAWPSGTEWLKAQSSGLRDRVKYNARRMAKAGFEARVCDSAEKRVRIIDTLIAQKRPWLAERGLASFIDEPGGAAFLQAVVGASWERGELHLSTVENAERIAACDLAFVRDGIIYSYMASFDPEYRKYSFGRVLTDCLFMWACDAGMRRLDLLLGAYDYKTEYNCTLEPVRTLVLPRGLVGRAALWLYRRKARQGPAVPASADAPPAHP